MRSGVRKSHAQKILLTRSVDDSRDSARLLTNLGYDVCNIPFIEIEPRFDELEIELIEQQLGRFDGFIFISINAAKYGADMLAANQDLLKQNYQVLAVGTRTAKELSEQFSNVLCPDNGVGAEALMATTEMADIHGQSFLVIRGKNGNAWLGEELVRRHASVDFYDCYTRRRPRTLEKELANTFTEQLFDVCFLHSAHAAANLIEASGKLGQAIIRTCAIVGSAAIKDVLIDYGWKGRIEVAASPKNLDMVNCLVALKFTD